MKYYFYIHMHGLIAVEMHSRGAWQVNETLIYKQMQPGYEKILINYTKMLKIGPNDNDNDSESEDSDSESSEQSENSDNEDSESESDDNKSDNKDNNDEDEKKIEAHNAHVLKYYKLELCVYFVKKVMQYPVLFEQIFEKDYRSKTDQFYAYFSKYCNDLIKYSDRYSLYLEKAQESELSE